MINNKSHWSKACLFSLPFLFVSLSTQANECDANRADQNGHVECWDYSGVPWVIEVTEFGNIIGKSTVAESTLLECTRSNFGGNCSIGLTISENTCKGRNYAFGLKSTPAKIIPASSVFKKLEALEFTAQQGRTYNACTTHSETVNCQAEQGVAVKAVRLIRYQEGEAVFNGPARVRGSSKGRNSLITRRVGEMPATTVAKCKRRGI